MPVASGRLRAAERAAGLSPGMNLPGWFWFADERTEPGARYPDERLARYRELGIRGVRIPADPFLVAGDADLRRPYPDIPDLLTACVSRCLDLGFSVVVNAHNGYPEPTDGLSERLQREPDLRRSFAAYWHELAGRLSGLPADRLLLEPLNEPVFDEPDAAAIWSRDLAPALVQAIRIGFPDATVLLSGPHAAAATALPLMAPAAIADDNVAFNFHMYEPYAFTHQGAPWAFAPIRDLMDLPYPTRSDWLRGRPATVRSRVGEEAIQRYTAEGWDTDRVVTELDVAIDWAAEHDVPLAVTEFGCYRAAPAPDRERWVRDVRSHLERRGVPWMAWTDQEGFGFEHADGRLDDDMLTALGLGSGGNPLPPPHRVGRSQCRQ